MKLPEHWKTLWNDDDFVSNCTALVKTLNGIASTMLIVLVVYFPYQAIREVLTWFN